VRTQPTAREIADPAATGPGRARDAGAWGVPLAAFAAVALTAGLSAALTVSRIDHGTATSGNVTPVAAIRK